MMALCGSAAAAAVCATCCDGSAVAHANAARTGGDATGDPPAAAGETEVDGSTIIFTCTDTGSVATATYTCGGGTFTETGGPVTCPESTCDGSEVAHADAYRTGGTATGTPPNAAGETETSLSTIVFTCDHAATAGCNAATATYTCLDGLFATNDDVCPTVVLITPGHSQPHSLIYKPHQHTARSLACPPAKLTREPRP